MAKAGYDPRAARDLWVRMAEAAKRGQRPPEFMSTHPSEETRIKQIEAWLPEALTVLPARLPGRPLEATSVRDAPGARLAETRPAGSGDHFPIRR